MGKESRGQRSVIVQDSTRKGCGGRVVVGVMCRVRMMARDVKQWIQRWLQHNLVIIGCERSQDIPRNRLTVVILCSENDLIPKGTELVLQFR